MKEKCKAGGVMSLLKTIQEAPVEWKELGEVAEVGTGKNNTNEQIENGKYPFYVRSKDIKWINTYLFDEEAIIIPGEGGIGDIFHYVNGKYGLHQRAYRVHIIDNKLNTKLLYYYMKSQFKNFIMRKAVSATVSSIRKPMIEKFKIPIPPLEIQEEIVQILDKFTEYVTELTAELTAELTDRKKQYSFYRDKLLSFSDEVYQVEWKTLGEIGKVSMCKRILKNQTSEVGDVPFYKIGTFGKRATAYISRELFEDYKEKYSYPKVGDILISASGTIGRTVVFNGEDSYFQDSNIVWLEHDESQILNRYLFYFYQMNPWQVSSGGTISRLYNGNIEKTKIPIPSLAIQERIVHVLDNFDTVCNDLKIGLPKEIELRQKQYEYYRDQLLTFDEKCGKPRLC